MELMESIKAYFSYKDGGVKEPSSANIRCCVWWGGKYWLNRTINAQQGAINMAKSR